MHKAAADIKPRAGGSKRAPEIQAPTHSLAHSQAQGTWGVLVGGGAVCARVWLYEFRRACVWSNAG